MTEPGDAQDLELRDHPDLVALRWRAGADLRDEQVAEERDAEQARWHERSLMDFAHECMNRDDRVTVAAGVCEYEGTLVAAHDRLLVMESGGTIIHFNPDCVVWIRVDHRGSGAATAGSTDLRSFEAALRMWEATGERIRLRTRDGRVDAFGRVLAVGRGHVYFHTDSAVEVAVDQDAVACAARARTTAQKPW